MSPAQRVAELPRRTLLTTCDIEAMLHQIPLRAALRGSKYGDRWYGVQHVTITLRQEVICFLSLCAAVIPFVSEAATHLERSSPMIACLFVSEPELVQDSRRDS